jgi:predicted dehydrogenase
MGSMSRRDFLHDSAALAAALAGSGLAGSALSAAAEAEPKKAKKAAANDRLHVAVIGVNGRGMSHVQAFANKNECVIDTICDVDEAVIRRAMTHVEKAQGKAPKFEKDLRRIMDDKAIDIVSIATPNHWHALAAVWAIQAGKDVYLEKPVSHNISEGRRIVEAARRYNRICQAGTQSRGGKGMRDAMEYLHSGKLGKLSLARGLCYKRRDSIGKVSGPQQPPKTMDYDLWCGPAPYKLPHRNSKQHGPVHYDWHWIWDYGNGDLGNQGIHEMDKARWGLNKNELPKSVVSVGGRFGYVDDGETANTQICLFDYGDCELIFEVRGLQTGSPYPAKFPQKKDRNFVGNIFYGTEGILVCPSYVGGLALNRDGEVIKEFSGKEDHFANFIKAVRSRKVEDLYADILEGHLSSALCHLGNISYRLGTLEPFSKQRRAFGDDKEAYETFARMEEHLKENNVPLEATSYRLGRKLAFDSKTERFVDDADANAMLTREYRKGFEVPARV